MNISVIFTGGTIGSLTKQEWVGIDETTNYMLLSKSTQSGVNFQTSSPYSILSENLSATELNALQQEISKILKQNPDGIIVTHGTDTIQYSAAAIEYAFADTKVPIVFVSADYPLDNPKSNGYINFEAAVEFIKSGNARGVFVSYKNENENEVKLHIASRLLRHGENSSDLHSIDGSVFAVYADGNISLCNTEFYKTEGIGPVCYTNNSHILSVDSRPGNSYTYLLDDVKAIIIKPYHSATLNTVSEGLTDLCKRASEQGIPVFVSGVTTGIGYESSKLFDELSIRTAPYSTYVSLYMKLWAAISLGRNIVEFADLRIANELV